MESFNERKLILLENTGKLYRAINDEVDWFIASFREKDLKRRKLARNIFCEKQKERVRLAKETYDRFK